MCEPMRTVPTALRTREGNEATRIGYPESWQAVFLRPAPMVWDLGAGNGRFAVAYAELHPEWNVLAVERKLHRVRQIERAVELRRIPNLKVLWFGWDDLLLYGSEPDSCREIHVLFPDPWPKRRHRNRRSLRTDVLTAILRALEPGGLFRFLTDDADYAAAVGREVAHHPRFERREERGGFPTSHFEQIFRNKADRLHGGSWRKAEGGV